MGNFGKFHAYWIVLILHWTRGKNEVNFSHSLSDKPFKKHGNKNHSSLHRNANNHNRMWNVQKVYVIEWWNKKKDVILH